MRTDNMAAASRPFLLFLLLTLVYAAALLPPAVATFALAYSFSILPPTSRTKPILLFLTVLRCLSIVSTNGAASAAHFACGSFCSLHRLDSCRLHPAPAHLSLVPLFSSAATMGHSAKITRGGNKKRVNQGRLEVKLRAQGAKSHTTAVKEAVEARRFLKQRAQAIAGELKAKVQRSGSAPSRPEQLCPTNSGPSIVRMAPKPIGKPKPPTQSEK